MRHQQEILGSLCFRVQAKNEESSGWPSLGLTHVGAKKRLLTISCVGVVSPFVGVNVEQCFLGLFVLQVASRVPLLEAKEGN